MTASVVEFGNALKELLHARFSMPESKRLRLGITGDRVTNQERFHEQVRRCSIEGETVERPDVLMPMLRVTGMMMCAHRGAQTLTTRVGFPRMTHVRFVHEHDTVDRSFGTPDYVPQGNERYHPTTGRKSVSEFALAFPRVPPLTREPVFSRDKLTMLARTMYVIDDLTFSWQVRSVRSHGSTSRAQLRVERYVMNSILDVHFTAVEEGGYDMHLTLPTILMEKLDA